MPIEAMMQELGEVDGLRLWWAAPGKFERPGVYFWNGNENVRICPEPRPEWYGVQDEVALTRAVSVMEDVLTDIEGWEDKALAEAIESSKTDLAAMIECIRMNADPSYIPGTRPIAALARQAPAPLSQAVPAGFWLAPMVMDVEMIRAAGETPGMKEIDSLSQTMQLRGYPANPKAFEGGAPLAQAYLAMRDSWIARHPQPQAVTEDARDGERKS